MRFMTLIKAVEGRVGAPPPELFQAIAALGAEAAQSGALIETAGLLPTSAGGRVRLEGGRIAASEGPHDAGGEVVGGYAIFEVPSKQEAMRWATRFMELHRDHWRGWEGETEVRQLSQPTASVAEATRG